MLKKLNGKKLDKKSFLMKSYLYFRLYHKALKQSDNLANLVKYISAFTSKLLETTETKTDVR
jgi:hypothetical protein